MTGKRAMGQSNHVFLLVWPSKICLPWLIEIIRHQSLTIADWGCAQGDGTDLVASFVNPQQMVGVDFSEVAIEQATKRYPALQFATDNWLEEIAGDIETYDVVFSSNTLEHFHQPYEVLDALCKRADKAVILALPYRELERFKEHFCSFLPENIPLNLPAGFRLVWSRVIDCSNLPGSCWPGEQVLLVYGKTSWLESLNLTLSDGQLEQVDNAAEILDLGEKLAARDEQIAMLNQDVVERDEQITMLSQNVATLSQNVAERDEQISMLHQNVAEQNEQISKLSQELSERYEQISKLNNGWAERDVHIARLIKDVAERDGQISNITTSAGWRLTAPLRFLFPKRISQPSD